MHLLSSVVKERKNEFAINRIRRYRINWKAASTHKKSKLTKNQNFEKH